MKRSVLAVAAALSTVALVGFVVSPAFGGPGFLTSKQAKKLFVTKKAAGKFLTKASAGSTYLTKAEGGNYASKAELGNYASKAEADGKYLPASAATTIQVSPENWIAASGSGTTEYFTNVVELKRASSGVAFFNAGLQVPSQLQGRPVKLAGMELCYNASSAASIIKVLLQIEGTFVVEDNTKRTDEVCRAYSPASPASIGAHFVDVVVKGEYTSAGQIEVTRLTVNLVD